MYIQTLSYTLSHHTIVFWSILNDGSGLGEIQVAHPGCYTGLMKWWSLRVKLLGPRRGPYQNPPVIAWSLRALPNPHINILRVLPNSLTHVPYDSLCTSLRVLPKSSSTRTHIPSQHYYRGPYQNPFIHCVYLGWQHPIQMIGPYQTPTSPTKTHKLGEEKKTVNKK